MSEPMLAFSRRRTPLLDLGQGKIIPWKKISCKRFTGGGGAQKAVLEWSHERTLETETDTEIRNRENDTKGCDVTGPFKGYMCCIGKNTQLIAIVVAEDVASGPMSLRAGSWSTRFLIIFTPPPVVYRSPPFSTHLTLCLLFSPY